jgi:hypothetical protein
MILVGFANESRWKPSEFLVVIRKCKIEREKRKRKRAREERERRRIGSSSTGYVLQQPRPFALTFANLLILHLPLLMVQEAMMMMMCYVCRYR